MSVEWRDDELSSARSARRAEVFLLAPGYWSLYDPMHLLYVPNSPAFLYCTDVYMNSGDYKEPVEIFARMDDA